MNLKELANKPCIKALIWTSFIPLGFLLIFKLSELYFGLFTLSYGLIYLGIKKEIFYKGERE